MEHEREKKSKGNGVDHDCIDPTGIFLAVDGEVKWPCENCCHPNTSRIHTARPILKCAECGEEFICELFLQPQSPSSDQ